MKKMILSLMSVTLGCAAFAANCVSVKQIGTDYANHQITIALTRSGCTGDGYSSLHRNTVWVFVDYRPVTITTKGAWGRAVITATDKGTLVSANKGVWVTGSANATQRVTLTLDVIGDKFDWCAFASDCPPNALLENGAYTLRGTPPFTVDGVQLDDTQKTYPAGTYCISSMTDATGNPDGFINNLSCTCPAIQPGTVGFTSTQTWVVGAQTWSAPVTATYCNKSTFNGGSSGAYNSDCRTNSSAGYGHLFSWCMAVKFAATLCPSGWRVPTVDEFIALYNTSGMGNSSSNFVSRWGGQYGGIADGGSLYSQGSHGCYWSQSEYTADTGRNLYVPSSGSVYPQGAYNKNTGFTLRCVR